MRRIIIILLYLSPFFIFFSGISKERRLWIGYSLGEGRNRTDGFVWTIAAETREEATQIYLRDRKKWEGTYKFRILNADGLTTDYNIWEITDSIIHKK